MNMDTDNRDKLCLVTGATGFTGGHLARMLNSRGHRVRAYVRSHDERAKALEQLGIELAFGDIADAQQVSKATEGCTHVYHIAALFRSAKHPDSVYHDVNVKGTQYVLDAAAKHNVQRTVHCSTVGVHGDVKEVPSTEESPFSPGDIYQRTKLEGETLAREAFSSGLPGCVFRPAGIYGPGDMRFLKLFKTIHTGKFRMFGSGEVNYHFTYIEDLCEGIILCGEHPAAIDDVFILAGPRWVPINELAGLVADAVGKPRPKGHLPLKPLEIAAATCEAICRPLGIEPPLHRRRLDFFKKERCFSYEKAKRVLGYSPKIDVAEGVRRTARWYFENGHLKGPAPAWMSEESQQREPASV